MTIELIGGPLDGRFVEIESHSAVIYFPGELLCFLPDSDCVSFGRSVPIHRYARIDLNAYAFSGTE